MARRERDILERAVRAVAEQAQNANAIVDEAHNGRSRRLTSRRAPSQTLRLELLTA